MNTDTAEKNVPIKVAKIRVEGQKNALKEDFLQAVFGPCLQAQTMQDLTDSLHSSMREMDRVGVWSDVTMSMNVLDAENHVEVVIDVRKDRRVKLNTGTELNTTAATTQSTPRVSWTCNASTFNVDGRGSRLDAHTSVSLINASLTSDTFTASSFSSSKAFSGHLTWSKPVTLFSDKLLGWLKCGLQSTPGSPEIVSEGEQFCLLPHPSHHRFFASWNPFANKNSPFKQSLTLNASLFGSVSRSAIKRFSLIHSCTLLDTRKWLHPGDSFPSQGFRARLQTVLNSIFSRKLYPFFLALFLHRKQVGLGGK